MTFFTNTAFAECPLGLVYLVKSEALCLPPYNEGARSPRR